MQIDAEVIGKVYAPVALVVGTLWKWYSKRQKVADKTASEHRTLIENMINRCESERKEDRRECRETAEKLGARLDAVSAAHAKDLSSAFNRVAESLEVMTRKRRDGNDPPSDIGLTSRRIKAELPRDVQS